MPIDLEQALRDPAASFAGPEDVVAHPDLGREQKIEILRLWEYDAAEAAVATEEGMPGGDNGLLARILAALAALGAGAHACDTGPTKQHALVEGAAAHAQAMSALDKPEAEALEEALDDEYRAWATYDQVVRDFGALRPFVNIRDAEARHIDALLALFARYGLQAPLNPWPGKVARYASVREACESGVAAEIANAEMYERLLAAARHPDIAAVLRNLQRASQERHLPAFQRCAARGAAAGAGGGRRRRGRRP